MIDKLVSIMKNRKILVYEDFHNKPHSFHFVQGTHRNENLELNLFSYIISVLKECVLQSTVGGVADFL